MKKMITLSFVVIILLFAVGYFILPKLRRSAKKSNDKIAAAQSIAVLPFVNMSNEPGQEYFIDGVTDGMLNSIAQLKNLKVSARTSSFTFREQDPDIQKVGEKLDVRTVLKGTVQMHNDSVQITVQLIDVENEAPFWSEIYDDKLENIFALQDKIANVVAVKLELTSLGGKPIPASQKTISVNEAYDLYLKGRSCWNLGTPADLKKAIELFQQAIALDPFFARAYSGIADCYNALGYGSHLAPKDAAPKAKDAAMKAFELDSTLAEPHASLGFYKFYYEWDWAAAEDEFRIALALNPNYELGYKWYGYYLTAMERYDEANIILKKAGELDPLSVPISTDMGFSMYYKGDYDVAIKKLRASLQMNPKFPFAHLWLGRSYQAKKMYKQAIAEYKSALEKIPDWPVGLAHIGNVYGVSGKKAAGQIILDTLNALARRKFVTSYGMALIYAGLDEKEKAFEWLNKAVEERSNWLVWLKTDPRWIPLRTDKRFALLVNSVGLPL